jgi:hypothetical protein
VGQSGEPQDCCRGQRWGTDSERAPRVGQSTASDQPGPRLGEGKGGAHAQQPVQHYIYTEDSRPGQLAFIALDQGYASVSGTYQQPIRDLWWCQAQAAASCMQQCMYCITHRGTIHAVARCQHCCVYITSPHHCYSACKLIMCKCKGTQVALCVSTAAA